MFCFFLIQKHDEKLNKRQETLIFHSYHVSIIIFKKSRFVVPIFPILFISFGSTYAILSLSIPVHCINVFCILAMLIHLLPLEHFYIRYFQCFALDIQTYEGWV